MLYMNIKNMKFNDKIFKIHIKKKKISEKFEVSNFEVIW